MSKIFLVHHFPIIKNEICLLIEEQYPSTQINCFDTFSQFPAQSVDKGDVLIIHIDDSNTGDLKVLNMLKGKGVKIITWIESEDETKIRFILQQKFQGYFLNKIETFELLEALEYMYKNSPYLHPKLSSILLTQYISESKEQSCEPRDSILTNREWDVLQLMSCGCSNEQVATQLFLTESTVKNHVSSILHKLEVPDRTSAVLKALKNKWIMLES